MVPCQVKLLMANEQAYINTAHPDFVGGVGAVHECITMEVGVTCRLTINLNGDIHLRLILSTYKKFLVLPPVMLLR